MTYRDALERELSRRSRIGWAAFGAGFGAIMLLSAFAPSNWGKAAFLSGVAVWFLVWRWPRARGFDCPACGRNIRYLYARPQRFCRSCRLDFEAIDALDKPVETAGPSSP